jgi:hypothetical protein
MLREERLSRKRISFNDVIEVRESMLVWGSYDMNLIKMSKASRQRALRRPRHACKEGLME